MGRLTSGEYNFYGRGKDQVDLAKQNRLNDPYGKQSTIGVFGATLLPNLIAGIATCYAVDPNCEGGGSSVRSKKADNEVTPESLQQEIDTKLAEVKCSDIETVRGELTEQSAKLPELDKAISTATETLTNLQNGLAEAKGVLADAKSEIEVLEQLKAEGSPEFDSARYEYLTVTLPKQIEKAEKEQIPAAEKALTEAKEAQAPVAARVTELQSALKYLEPRVKQLNELELTNAVEQYNNKESKNILSLVKKLNNETDQEKRLNLTKDLNSAVREYYAKHEVGECPTIDKLHAAQSHNAYKNFKPDTSMFDEKVAQLGLGFNPRKIL